MRELQVAISTGILGSDGGLERLCPAPDLRWRQCRFTVNPATDQAFDFLIVYARAPELVRVRVAPENTLFLAGEPPSKKVYPEDYYAQFHHVVSCNPKDPHPRVIHDFLGLPWHVGLDRGAGGYTLGHAELAEMAMPDKQNLVSVVCSNATRTDGQRRRLAFLARLKDELGDRVVHFGRGFTPIDDKLDAILPYRFHLAMENSVVDHYWTEKLADALLGWAYPVYYGCPNIGDYFPGDCLRRIDIEKPREAIDSIRALLDAADPPSSTAIRRCRDRVLDDYNPFTRFAHWARQLYQADRQAQALEIRNHRHFRKARRRLLRRIAGLIRPN